MNREEYAVYLETQSRYCACSAVQPLRRQGVEVEKLVRICERDYDEADLDDPKPEDRKHLETLSENIRKLKEVTATYNQTLTELISQEKLRLVENDRGGEIKPPVITINCVRCEQQIEVKHE